ncbi:Lrp/AsnC family transcriptional regulator [Sciscionella sediminilitoris]|uniref:Lrp/AsnC family transcriptional regulator n=1 Tax=Sciscionella sediminilitoris TaxID=1445613 RepID=UPI0004DF66A0|nr:Lrp/AsnC family transcriptional regulator [Sciscionella sp. SE31]
MPIVRQELDETDRRIAAALLAAPRAPLRTIATCLGLSERTVVRRTGPLFADGVLRSTAVRNPFGDHVPLALRVRCRPNRIQEIARTLAHRGDTLWVDILGSGDEISMIAFLDGPEARVRLLLRDLPATTAVHSWRAYTLLRVFPRSFSWTAGLLSAAEMTALCPDLGQPRGKPDLDALDEKLITALAEDGRAGYTRLAHRIGSTAVTVRRRLDALVRDQAIRLATEIDLTLLGVRADALLWLSVPPASAHRTGELLSERPEVRFAAATTGATNLLVAAATEDLDTLYRFLTDTIGGITAITNIETTPILATRKRTGLTY